MVLERIEPSFQKLPPVREPPLGRLEGLALQPARPHPTHLRRPNEPAVFENAEMLNERRQCHVEGLGQLGNRRGPIAEPPNDCPSRRIGKGTEDGVERFEMVRHLPKY